MGNLSKTVKNSDGIHRAVSPKSVLRQRGLSYDGTSFVPQLPDYLGYLLGMLLIWLAYTTYISIVGVYQTSKAEITKLGAKAGVQIEAATEKIDKKFDKMLTLNQRVATLDQRRRKGERGSLEVPAKEDVKDAAGDSDEGYLSTLLGYAERITARLSSAAGAAFDKLFGDSEDPPQSPAVRREEKGAAGEDKSELNHSLDRF